MQDNRWGNDPEPVEDSHAIQRKLLWLAICASSGAVPFALSHWMLGERGFHWWSCVISALCGCAAVMLFSRAERLPMSAGIFAGLITGAGAYVATVGYVYWRSTVFLVELAIPALLGAFPGLVLYVVIVRDWYWVAGDEPSA